MIHEPLPQELEAAPEERRGTILIVDDDRDQAHVLARSLERNGYVVATEERGERALARAAAARPDLVLLDLTLPDLCGLQVCRQLADSPETCGTPVIVVSGQDDADIVRKCRAAGSEYYVRKPYDPNVLLALIERTLDAW